MSFTDDFDSINESLIEDSRKLQNQYQQLKTTLEQCTNLSSRLVADSNKIRGQNFIKNIASKGISSFGSSSINSSSISKIMNFMSSFVQNTRAGGGNVSQGVPYLVGERGPEMFIPSSGGSITPNNASVRQKSVNIVMNITTPDIGNFQKSRNQIMSELARAMRKADL